MSTLSEPLSDEEVEELAELLDDLDAAPLEWCEGLFTGVAALAPAALPAAWLELVFGGPPAFESAEDEPRVTELLTRAYGDCAGPLADGEGCICPEADDEEGVRAWCGGFLAALTVAKLVPEEQDEEFQEAMAVMALLAGLVTDEDLKEKFDPAEAEQMLREMREDLPSMAVWCREHRLAKQGD